MARKSFSKNSLAKKGAIVKSRAKKSGNSMFFWAAIAGIITAVLFIPQLAFELARAVGYSGGNAVYVVLSIITTITYSVFVWGFREMGSRTKNELMVWSSYALIALGIISEVYVLATLDSGKADLLAHILLVLSGIAGIVFGFGLLRLAPRFGRLATATGVIVIGQGAAIASILLVIIAVILFIPTYVLEIILLFKAKKKL